MLMGSNSVVMGHLFFQCCLPLVITKNFLHSKENLSFLFPGYDLISRVSLQEGRGFSCCLLP